MQKDDRVAVLQAIFDCPEDVARELNHGASWGRARRHDTLLHQGLEQRLCYIIVSGSADIRVLGRDGQCVQIATVEPGEIAGPYPTPGPVAADVRAQNSLEFVAWDTARLAQAAATHAAVGAGLAGIFARQLASVVDRFAARVTLTAAGRVYACLLKLVDADGSTGSVPAVAALAVQAQTTRETASRAIASLERRGILRREGGVWAVVSRRMLEELVL